jgi:hypothetical protein
VRPIDNHGTIVSVAGMDVAYSYLDISLIFEKLLEASQAAGIWPEALAFGVWIVLSEMFFRKSREPSNR